MVRILKWLSTAMVVALWVVACGEVPRGVFTGASSGVASSSGGLGGAGGSFDSSSSSGLGGMGAGAGASSSSGVPVCAHGGEPCATFSDCCSGTCASNVCTQCATTGTKCAPDGCCLGSICYSGLCGTCNDDGEPCQQSADCCSTVCSQGTCAALACSPIQSCGSYCANVDSDPLNCGACGNKCDAGNGCCGGVCVALGTEKNCSACGHECGWDSVCASGACVTSPFFCEFYTNGSVGVGGAPVLSSIQYSFYAWEFTSPLAISVRRMELHTTDGAIFVFADGGTGAPGPGIWGQAIAPSGQVGWRGADALAPFNLLPGTKYWIAHQGTPDVTPASLSVSGAPMPFVYGSSPVSTWYDGNGSYQFTAHVSGLCP